MSAKGKKVKLLNKASQGFIVTSAVLMLVSTVVLYFYVKQLLQEEVEEELYSTSARIESALRLNHSPYQLPPVVEITPVDEPKVTIIKDTLIYDPSQEEMEDFRELTQFKQINGQNYQITVRTLVVESEDILIAVLFSYVIIILVVFLFQFYFNQAKNKLLWRPFFHNLEAMKAFSLSSDSPISLEESEILEFAELNDEISTLITKVRADYKNLKQFTEDVSHEMQTPLAIIQAKIENIINENDLSDIRFANLTSIQKDIKRLTQMNKRLTLLTKIENNQFMNIENVNITKLVGELIKNFHEISSIEIEFIKGDDVFAEMDPYLAEILCNNLISNALKYSSPESKICVSISDNLLSIINSGMRALEHPEKLYSRFYRESDGAKSTGLGLAIVKRICDHYGFRIQYNFSEGQHNFSINFN